MSDEVKKNRGNFLMIMLALAGLSSIVNVINFCHPLYPGEIYLKNFYYLDLFNILTVILGAVGVIGSFYWKKWAILLAIIGPACWQIAQIIYLPMFLTPANYILILAFDVLLIWSFAKKWKFFN